MATHSPIRRLFPILLINLTGFAIAIPVLPALAYALGGSAVDVGLLYAVQSLGQFIMAPLWGKFSDRLGRKPILLATFAAAALMELVTAFVGSLAFLYLTRFLVGLCAGNVATASALIADSTDSTNRSKGMAIIGISFGVGFTLGPAIGAAVGIIAEPGVAGITGAGLPFAVAALMNLITLVLGILWLVEPSKDPRERAKNRAQRRADSIWKQLQRPPVFYLCALFLAYTIALTVLEGTFFIYMEEVYGYDIVEVGFLLAAMGLLTALFHGAVHPLSRRIGDRNMVVVGVMTLGLALTIAPIYPPLWFLLTALSFAAFGRAIVHPGILSLMSTIDPHRGDTGQLMGMLTSASSLGRIIGPAVGGIIFAHISPQAPFYLAGLLLLITGLVWILLWRRHDHSTGAAT